MQENASSNKSSETSDEVIDVSPEKNSQKEVEKVKKDIRIDIQILRAISIILVLLYHLGVPIMTGGFIGVDIFFVISGYLVTGSFIRELQKRYKKDEKQEDVIWKRFQDNIYISFLIRRIKRLILPSSVCLLLILIAVCVSPLEIPRGLESVRYAALNYINFWLWQISGQYGTDDTKMDVVLHFWSLAVEWQFYYVSPLVLILVWKVCEYVGLGELGLKNMFRASLFIASALTFGLVFSGQSPARFYLLHTRAWEFLVGAVASMEEKSFDDYVIQPVFRWCRSEYITELVFDWVVKIVVIVLFLALSAAGYFIPFGSNNWPGWWTLYPVGLAVAVIILQRKFEKTLITRPLVLVGDWSYSIYLYHWPIIVFSKVYMLSANAVASDPFFWGTCLFLSFAAGITSYYLVEKISGWLKVQSICWVGIFVLCTGLIVGLTFIPLHYYHPPPKIHFDLQPNITRQETNDLVINTWAMRQGPNVWLTKSDAIHAWDNYKRDPELLFARNSSRCMLLIGDSHSQEFHTPWNDTAAEWNASFYRLTRGCRNEPCYADVIVNSLPVPSVFSGCKHLVTLVGLADYGYQGDTLTLWQASFKRVVSEYAKIGQVFINKDLAWKPNDPSTCILDNAAKDITYCKQTVAQATTATPKYESIINDLKGNENIGIVDVLPHLTTSEGFVYAYNFDYPLFYDTSHLSENFMIAFSETFRALMKQDKVFQRFIAGL